MVTILEGGPVPRTKKPAGRAVDPRNGRRAELEVAAGGLARFELPPRRPAWLGDGVAGREDVHEACRALEGRGPEQAQGGPDRRIRPQPFRGLRRGLEERRRGALARPREEGARGGPAALGGRRLPRRPPRPEGDRARGSRGG